MGLSEFLSWRRGRSSTDGRTAEEDIAFNAQWAQTAFDLNFNTPVPPPSPELRIFPAINIPVISVIWQYAGLSAPESMSDAFAFSLMLPAFKNEVLAFVTSSNTFFSYGKANSA